MSASELRNLIFEKLFAEFVEGRDEPLAFVGIQGDGLLVVMHELGFMATFMGWLGLAWLAGSLAALVVATGYAAWWIAR